MRHCFYVPKSRSESLNNFCLTVTKICDQIVHEPSGKKHYKSIITLSTLMHVHKVRKESLSNLKHGHTFFACINGWKSFTPTATKPLILSAPQHGLEALVSCMAISQESQTGADTVRRQ